MTGDKDRADFEAAYAKAFPNTASLPGWFRLDMAGAYCIDSVLVGWIIWQAATAAERGRAAKVCIAFGKTLEVDVGENFAEAIRSGE